MELKIRTLRERIAATIGEDMKNEGFTIDTSLTWLKKSVNKKNKIRIFVDCYDYSPHKLEFRLVFQFLIYEIEKEREYISAFFKQPFIKNFYMSFSEGYFHPETRGLLNIYQNAFNHPVFDLTTLDYELEACRKVLREDIMPFFPTFSLLENFQDFILNNYQYFKDERFVIAGSLAMRLKGDSEFKIVTDFFRKKFQISEAPDDNALKLFMDSVDFYNKT